MRMIKGPALLALALMLVITTFAAGQNKDDKKDDKKGRRNQEQQQAPQAPAAPQNVGPVPQSKDEYDGYMAVQNEQNPAKKIELAEAFVAKYPNSDFVQYAHTFRATAYNQTGKQKESVAAAEQGIDSIVKFGEKLVSKADADSKLTDKDKEALRKKDKNAYFLDKNSPQFQSYMSQAEGRILLLYQTVIADYQQLNDASKMVEWGEKALGFKPDDLNTLAMLSNVMAERPPTNDEEKTKQMKRAEELANQALTQLPVFLASPEGKNISAQAKSDITSQLHYTLGLVYLQQKRLGSSEQEFATALQAKPNDPITYYRLGIAYLQDMKNDQSMEALGKSAFLKGVSEAGARDLLKQLYVQKNKSEQGLDDYIKTAGAKIGQ